MDIQQRIANILDDHRESFSQNTAWDECKYCSHNGTWAEHVAGMLVSELGLTREEDLLSPMLRSDYRGQRHRYVTEWVPDA